MAKSEWGLKRTCVSCETRFYDMRREEPECPNCGTIFDPMGRGRRNRRATESRKGRVKSETQAVPPALEEDTEVLIEEELEDEIDLVDGDEVEETATPIGTED